MIPGIYLFYATVTQGLIFLPWILLREHLAARMRKSAVLLEWAGRSIKGEAGLGPNAQRWLRSPLFLANLGKPLSVALVVLMVPGEIGVTVGAREAAQVVAILTIAWASIRLLILSYVNPKRGMLEELQSLVLLGQLNRRDPLKLAVLTEAFVENKYALNLSLTDMYDRLRLANLSLEPGHFQN